MNKKDKCYKKKIPANYKQRRTKGEWKESVHRKEKVLKRKKEREN